MRLPPRLLLQDDLGLATRSCGGGSILHKRPAKGERSTRSRTEAQKKSAFMMLMYALEKRSNWFVLAFACGCALSSVYGFLAGASAASVL